jgi:hypothetical protein
MRNKRDADRGTPEPPFGAADWRVTVQPVWAQISKIWRKVHGVSIGLDSRKYSAGRLWIVLPALLARFCGDAGVGSVAWVPA